jgi:hypothetical protein
MRGIHGRLARVGNLHKDSDGLGRVSGIMAAGCWGGEGRIQVRNRSGALQHLLFYFFHCFYFIACNSCTGGYRRCDISICAYNIQS